MEITQKLKAITAQFQVDGSYVQGAGYGNGHINDTYCIVCELADGSKKRYILQRMNQQVFQKPLELMENIVGVTTWLRNKVEDPLRHTLNIVPTATGQSCYLDSEKEYWRMYLFIEDATCYDRVEQVEDFYESAVAFGKFQNRLAEYPAATLHETIPNFHNTMDRFEKLQRAVERDCCNRVQFVTQEIAFFLEREELAQVLGKYLAEGKLPLRVTHNDTKLNNIMIDNKTHQGICIIDLDTVMPGLALHDFGDAIRFGASTAAEDEEDLSKVHCDMTLFESYVAGYLVGCGGSLTSLERELLPLGAIVMTYECGMRFLTDYLQGDTYFKIHRPDHNLIRARTQMALVKDMETKITLMNSIVSKYAEENV